MATLEPVFTLVNEDGSLYAEFDNFEDALAMLREYPNDLIEVTLTERK